MVVRKPDQMQGLLGHLTFGAVHRRPKQGMHPCNERGGVHNRIELCTYQRFVGYALVVKKPFSNVHPWLTLLLVGRFCLAMRLRGKGSMVPSQHQGIHHLIGPQRKQCPLEGCHVLTRYEDITQMGPKRCEQCHKLLIIDCLDHVEEGGQGGANAFTRAKPTPGRTKGSPFSRFLSRGKLQYCSALLLRAPNES
jgi:hypothetical protein